MQQHTLRRDYSFEGKGLHTGKISKMTVCPAPAGNGITFIRTDLGGLEIPALAENVTSTARCSTLGKDGAEILTVEHIMSALTGLGVDNAVIKIDNCEVPILDGSASPYIKSFTSDGTLEQEAERQYIQIPHSFEFRDEKSGSYIQVEPAPRPSYDLTVDFGSKVLGVQKVHWDEDTDYASQIGVCRTFVFFHEIEYLFANNLIKGGDVDNAIVIVEHPVAPEQLARMSALFGRADLEISEGYLNNLALHFPNECGRHKMLDMIGDFRLAGGWLAAKISAYKPGHTINTHAAKALRQELGLI